MHLARAGPSAAVDFGRCGSSIAWPMGGAFRDAGLGRASFHKASEASYIDGADRHNDKPLQLPREDLRVRDGARRRDLGSAGPARRVPCATSRRRFQSVCKSDPGSARCRHCLRGYSPPLSNAHRLVPPLWLSRCGFGARFTGNNKPSTPAPQGMKDIRQSHKSPYTQWDSEEECSHSMQTQNSRHSCR